MGYSFERIKRIICLRLVEHFPLLNDPLAELI